MAREMGRERAAKAKKKDAAKAAGASKAAKAEVDPSAALEVGKRCVVNGSQLGTILFVGEVHYAKGEFVGIELEDGGGKNNGTIKGTAYFSCPKGAGIMARSSDVVVVVE